MYSERSVEDLKERYYSIAEKLERVHGGATAPDQVKPNLVGGGGGRGSVGAPILPRETKNPPVKKSSLCVYIQFHISVE